jgi:hypothetical protein
MHGYNQGSQTVRDLMLANKPAVFMLQEHWLTPSNLNKFEENFPSYMCFGSSAMSSQVESGILRGRPFGGLMTLVDKSLLHCTEIVCAAERYVIVTIGNILLINVYMPCVGVVDRNLVCESILDNVLFYINTFPGHIVVLGGDLNTDLDKTNPVANMINSFSTNNSLYRCDIIVCDYASKRSTYYNEALNSQSTIDFFLTSDKSIILSFAVIECDINLSDHLPITISCICNVGQTSPPTDKKDGTRDTEMQVTQLRWDHADLDLYNHITGFYLQPVLIEINKLNAFDESNFVDKVKIDEMYMKVVHILQYSAQIAVPSHKKHYFKFWWDQEMDELKQQSISSCKLWKAAGRPRSGPVFTKYRKDKSAYRYGLRSRQRDETSFYTNDLHEALLNKHCNTFWQCWKSKFERNKQTVSHVDGTAVPDIITDHFADYFSKACSNLTAAGADRLKTKYEGVRSEYCGMPDSDEYLFDAELVESVIVKLNRGKAAGLDGLTAEHLQYCHASLPCILAKLFNMMMRCGHVPASFGQSYTVPIPKGNNAYSKSMNVADFRGISISCVVSKVMEHCIFDRYQSFFATNDNQFGFKKGYGCSHAIYTLRCAIDHYNSRGTTVNLCSIDLTKAFDKMNHHGLFIKLMEKFIPVNLLSILESWFEIGLTCVKWGTTCSQFFSLNCGIRQGGVLSPYFFATYIDSLIDKVRKEYFLGCYVKWQSVTILLYADDIIIIAPTVMTLQKLLHIVELELEQLDMQINVMKSHCMRIGPRHDVACCTIITRNGIALEWVDTIRYLGIELVSGKNFTCLYSKAKQSFYRAFNSIFGKVGRLASEEVVLELVETKCLPIMLYGLEACPINVSQVNSLQFAVTGMLMKLFCTKDKNIINDCMLFFGFNTVCNHVLKRKHGFLSKYSKADSNSMCSLFCGVAASELTAINLRLK